MSETSPCPPDDDRKWITTNEAAAMLRVGVNRFLTIAKQQEFTSFRKPGYGNPRYFLYSEIDSLAEFRRMRRAWTRKYQISGRQPRYIEKIDPQDLQLMTEAKRFISRAEAAALLSVSPMMVSDLVYRGRLIAYQTNPGQRGSKMWFSRRAVLLYKDDPDRLKAQAVQRGEYRATVSLATGYGVKKARNPQKVQIPLHLITIAEAAERLGLNRSTIHDLRKRGRLRGEKLWKGNKTLRYWYVSLDDLELLIAEREEIKARNAAKEAAPSPPVPAAPRFTPPRRPEDHEIFPEPHWACDERPL